MHIKRLRIILCVLVAGGLAVGLNLSGHAGGLPYSSPTITTTTLPAGQVGTTYSGTLTATGGSTPYMWSISMGSLPAGLTLDPTTGAITGTPTSTVADSFTVEVSDANSSTATATLSITITTPPGAYTPLSPTRICDTRAGNPSALSGTANQCNNQPLTAGTPLAIEVGGNFNVPAGATAAVLNVTAISGTAQGYLSVYPTGGSPPTASNVNFPPGRSVPNLVEVGLGTDGMVSFVSNVSTNFVVDLEGYVAASDTGAGLYNPLATPARICDTRSGNPSNLTGGAAQCNGKTLVASTPLSVNIDDVGGVPSTGVSAVVLNVTVVNPASQGYLSVYSGGPAPTASNLNYRPGQTVPNRVIVPVSGTGTVDLIADQSVNAIVDVSGWYSTTGGTGGEFTAEPTPVRICDTRADNPSGLSGGAAQCNGAPLGAGQSMSVQVTGLAGVPSDATAVVVNVTAISPSSQTHLTVYPGETVPGASDLNPAAGEVEANLVVATLSPTGTINIYNYTGSVNVAVDVAGWYQS